MGKTTHRTWKCRDIQGLSPLCWCKNCGGEIYFSPGRDRLCPRCRRENAKRQEEKP